MSEQFAEFFRHHDCLTITGPTGVGKTGLAIALGEVWPIEIISMDSALVYKGMDIGTAKPSAVELSRVPHHLIDIKTPLESYNAAQFSADAGRLIHEIRLRGKLPVLVGGTLLYFKALFDGLSELPQTDPLIRAEIAALGKERGWPAMHEMLMSIDPLTAQRLAPADSQRISRALEVHRISGKPMSSFFAEPSTQVRGPALRNKLISLEPRDRAWLHQRLADRFDQMIEQGFVQEVLALRHNPHLNDSLPSMRCVGYRQIWQALDAGETLSVEQLAHVKELGVAATRQLAKRQLTWLRSLQERTIIECDKDNGRALCSDLFEILGIGQ